MKSERRHELKENVLASELGRLRDLLNRYGNWIMGAVLAVVVIVAMDVAVRIENCAHDVFLFNGGD